MRKLFLYKKNGENIYHHEHVIFSSPFQINKMIISPHLYFDATFIQPKDFNQLIIVLYYDKKNK